MALYQIKHRDTSAILFEFDCKSLRICVEEAVKRCVSLTGAKLIGADLAGADLTGAYLRGTVI